MSYTGRKWRVSWTLAAVPPERTGEYPGHQQQYPGKELESVLDISNSTQVKNWRISWALATVLRERIGEYSGMRSNTRGCVKMDGPRIIM
jgi:hypothetical protein